MLKIKIAQVWWTGLDKFPITSGTTAVVVATLMLFVLEAV